MGLQLPGAVHSPIFTYPAARYRTGFDGSAPLLTSVAVLFTMQVNSYYESKLGGVIQQFSGHRTYASFFAFDALTVEQASLWSLLLILTVYNTTRR